MLQLRMNKHGMQVWTTLWINVKLVQKSISSIKVLHKFFLCRCWCLLMWCNKHPTQSYAWAKSCAYERFCMKRTFITIRPVVIVVNHFSLWAIVSATLVVKKTRTSGRFLSQHFPGQERKNILWLLTDWNFKLRAPVLF